MYKVDWTSKFKKDYKKIAKQGKVKILDSIIEKLQKMWFWKRNTATTHCKEYIKVLGNAT